MPSHKTILGLLLTIIVAFSVQAEEPNPGPQLPQPPDSYYDNVEMPGFLWKLLVRFKGQDPQARTTMRRSVIQLDQYLLELAMTKEGVVKIIHEFGLEIGRPQRGPDRKWTFTDTKYYEAKNSLYKLLRENSVVANIFHKGKFYIGVIPKNNVEEIQILVEHNKPPTAPAEEGADKASSTETNENSNAGLPDMRNAAHTMMRVVFDEEQPITLTASVADSERIAEGKFANKLKPKRVLNDILYSVEADASASGYPNRYSQLKGQVGLFILSLRLVTVEQKAKVIDKKKRKAFIYEVPFSKGQANRVFNAMVDLSNEVGMSKTYNTLWRSCTETLFQIIESVLSHTEISSLHDQKVDENGVTLVTNKTVGPVQRVLNRIYLRFQDILFHHTQVDPQSTVLGLVKRGYIPEGYKPKTLREVAPQFFKNRCVEALKNEGEKEAS